MQPFAVVKSFDFVQLLSAAKDFEVAANLDQLLLAVAIAVAAPLGIISGVTDPFAVLPAAAAPAAAHPIVAPFAAIGTAVAIVVLLLAVASTFVIIVKVPAFVIAVAPFAIAIPGHSFRQVNEFNELNNLYLEFNFLIKICF